MTEEPRPATGITAAEYSAAVAEYTRRVSGLDEYVMRASLNLLRNGNTLMRISEREVHRARGLSWSGFSVLFTLAVFGDLEARTIARLTGVTKQAASAVLATLERDAYVRRSRGTVGDRRIVRVSLTEPGREAVRDGLTGQAHVAEHLLSDLDADEVRTLNGLLERILQTAGGAPDEGFQLRPS